MIKKILSSFIIFTGALASFSVLANESTNNLLSLSKEVTTIPQQCQQLFQKAEELIADAEKQPGTHTQIHKMKNRLNQSKKQILEMELATQTKSCDHGLAKLNALQQESE
ncbi:DUF5339 domain-containing protein [Volucribacter amazonae]|uniref:Recombinase XerD n=1 Tax=Volucribacter amazonae TaxID=256731 RepID=A0A9X4PEE1_9PAST|nr:DUF5339 domain-containing protein [Volucribacter amazonae]MDG6895866.1 hypothetical protein [Volucribacter amazonae]